MPQEIWLGGGGENPREATAEASIILLALEELFGSSVPDVYDLRRWLGIVAIHNPRAKVLGLCRFLA